MSKQYYRKPRHQVKPAQPAQPDVIKKIEEEDGEQVQVQYINPQYLYKVRVTHSSLRKRAEPSVNGQILGIISDKGEYYIYEEQDGWGQLDDGSWIMLKYTNYYDA